MFTMLCILLLMSSASMVASEVLKVQRLIVVLREKTLLELPVLVPKRFAYVYLPDSITERIIVLHDCLM